MAFWLTVAGPKGALQWLQVESQGACTSACAPSVRSRGENSGRHAGRFIEVKTNGFLCSLGDEPQIVGRLSASHVDCMQ